MKDKIKEKVAACLWLYNNFSNPEAYSMQSALDEFTACGERYQYLWLKRADTVMDFLALFPKAGEDGMAENPYDKKGRSFVAQASAFDDGRQAQKALDDKRWIEGIERILEPTAPMTMKYRDWHNLILEITGQNEKGGLK